ncbi:uncharacterized protein LOC102801318 [Saccoglossus kowalevskii]|uniref:Proteoglycan 4-like n=1 Tax=Saccoglossus kowalevskii TaxID=10224 RepID=A0ABM0M447_SACKO|nr:PREDICTED: proteoglycan 4-like [Saccoglossus kowalevskii]
MRSQGARYPIHRIIAQQSTLLVYALAFITLFPVKLTVAESDVCYYDEEAEVIFEDELYATSLSSSAWLSVPGVAIFLFLVAGIVICSYGSSWFVRSYMETCCEKCWSCGKESLADTDSTVDLPVYKDKKANNKYEKQDYKKTKENAKTEKEKEAKIDIDREGSTATETDWEVKVNEFLRDMPDGSSVNHLYTEDARVRKTSSSSCNGHVLNVEEIHTDTESPRTPAKVVKVGDEAQLNGVQSTSGTRVVVAGAAVTAQKAPNGTSKSNNRSVTAQKAGSVTTKTTTAPRTGNQPNRPTTAQRTGTSPVRPTTAQRTGTQPTRPTTAQRTGTQPTRPTTAQRTGTESTRPTTAHKTGTQPVRPVTAQRAGTQPTRPTTAQRTGTQPTRPTTAQRTGVQAARPTTAQKPGTQPVRPTTAQNNRPTTAQKTAKVSPEPPQTSRQGERPLTGSSGVSIPTTPTSARRREEKKKFDRAWNSVQTIQPLNLDDDDHLQIIAKPEPPKPLVGLRRPSVIQQQFRTTGRISKSIRRDSVLPRDSPPKTPSADQR